MMRFILGFALAAGLGLAADMACAQAFNTAPATNPYVQPAVSPLVNLNRNNNPGVNLYGVVKPQLATTKQLQSLQTQVTQQQLMPQLGTSNAEEDGMMANYAVTGHPAVFSNMSHYFVQAGGLIRPLQPPAPIIRR
jgi:hypothetical protein